MRHKAHFWVGLALIGMFIIVPPTNETRLFGEEADTDGELGYEREHTTMLTPTLQLISPLPSEGVVEDLAWTWMGGKNVRNQAGVYGTRGVPTPSNTPGARDQSISWTDAENHLWLFGGYGYDESGSLGYLNDLWRYNISLKEWTWMKGSSSISHGGNYGTQGVPTPSNTPGARDRSISWTDAENHLWLFGGYGYDESGSLGYLNDLWRYDISSNDWMWMRGSNNINQNGIYGIQRIPTFENTPGARRSSVSCIDAYGQLWLFGGYGNATSGSYGYLNDLWRYNLSSNEWTWMNGSNNPSEIGDYGIQGIPALNNTPGARDQSVSWTDAQGQLWLYGGWGYGASGSLGYLNDLWRFNISSNDWTWMKGSNINNQNGYYGTKGMPKSENTPGARYGSVSWTDMNGHLWLFGGHGVDGCIELHGVGFMNDLWRFNTTSLEWTWMKGSYTRDPLTKYGTKNVNCIENTPGGRTNMNFWFDFNGNGWLFGGFGYDFLMESGRLNDLWRISVYEEESDNFLKIRDWNDLYAVRYNLTGSYRLMNDLNSSTSGYQMFAYFSANEGLGWEPIGNESNTPNNRFNGIFDGRNFSINDIIINRTNMDFLGLFGSVYMYAIIKNLNLNNFSISGRSYVGGLIGNNSGEVRNCQASGRINGSNIGDNIGGLLGKNSNPNPYCETISYCRATVDVLGHNQIGGIIGYHEKGLITYTSALGNISGSSSVGGFVGLSNGYITNSSSFGNVNGSNQIGGFVGKAMQYISKCFSKGNVTGYGVIGGFVGHIETVIYYSYSIGNVSRTKGSSTYIAGFAGYAKGWMEYCYSTGRIHYEEAADPTNKGFLGGVYISDMYSVSCFWDIESSGQSSTTGIAKGRTTEQMMSLATFTSESWDISQVHPYNTNISNAWNIIENKSYPFLSWEPPRIVIEIQQPQIGQVFNNTTPLLSVNVETVNPLDDMWYTIDNGVTNYTFIEDTLIDSTTWANIENGMMLTLQFFANDTKGIVGWKETYFWKDIIIPSISVDNPLNGSIFGNEAPLFLIHADDLNLHAMWYTFDGGLTNTTFTANGTINAEVWAAVANGSVTLRFYVNDTANNLAWAESTFWKDMTVPSITIITPTQGQQFNETIPAFEVAILDKQLQTMWYTLDGGLTNNTFTANGTINSAIWSSLSDCLVTLRFYANNTLGNLAYSEVTFWKDREIPVITINKPFLGEVYGYATPLFEIEIYEKNLDTMWYTLDGGAINTTFITNGTINSSIWGALGNGTVTICFYANDSTAKIAWQEIIVRKDIIAPLIAINAPVSGGLFSHSPPSLHMEVLDPHLHIMWYTLDGGLTNTTFTANGTINAAVWNLVGNGTVMFRFYAIDMLGNLAWGEAWILKDIQGPSIMILAPSHNQVYQTIELPSFSLSILDAQLHQIWYSLDGGQTNIFFSGNGTIDQLLWHWLPNDAEYTICFYANDTLGNQAWQAITVEKRIIPSIPVLNGIEGPSTTGSVELSWDPVPYATHYKVYRSSTLITVLGDRAPIDIVTDTSFIDKGLVNGTYYYAIIAGNSLGDSPISNCESVVVEIGPTSERPNTQERNWLFEVGIWVLSGVVSAIVGIIVKKVIGRRVRLQTVYGPSDSLKKGNSERAHQTYQSQIITENLNGLRIAVDNAEYQLLKPIGKGGMGVIYLAKNVKTKQEVVVKQLLPNRYRRDEFGENSCREYWEREQGIIEIQSRSPKKTMHLIGAMKNESPEAYFLLLEYFNAPSLDQWRKNKGNAIDGGEIALLVQKIIAPLCEHLAFVHSGNIIHRDITPRNVLIVEENGNLTPILIDWGVSKELSGDDILPPKRPYITETSLITTAIRSVGNPPEVVAGCLPVVASDIYMVGALMYFLFTNQYPMPPTTAEDYVLKPSRINGFIPAGLDQLIKEMTQYEPADRLQSMGEVLERLGPFLMASDRSSNVSTFYPNKAKLASASQEPSGLHKYQAIFGQTPRRFVNQDPEFSRQMREAIEARKLSRVLVIATEKAKTFANEMRLSDLEIFQFAYELFAWVFDDVAMEEQLKLNLGETVNEHFMEAVGVVVSKK